MSDELQDVKFAENPEPRCPCVLLLDTSGSMNGAPIDELNAGLQAFQESMQQDENRFATAAFDIMNFNATHRHELAVSRCQGMHRDSFCCRRNRQQPNRSGQQDDHKNQENDDQT